MNDNSMSAPNLNSRRVERKLNAKAVKRRSAKISSGSDPRLIRKKKGKLAVAVLERIASGEVKNPSALAKAFFEDEPHQERAQSADLEAEFVSDESDGKTF